MTAVARGIPLYQGRIDGKPVSYVARTNVEAPVMTLMGQARGASACFGMLSKGGRLLNMALPETAGWTTHVSQVTGQARTALAIPYMYCVIGRCIESFKERKYLNGTRNALDACSSGNFVASALVTDRITSSFLGNLGGAIKTVVDGIDLGISVDKCFEYNSLRTKEFDDIEISEDVRSKVKSGISSQFKALILKVCRFALALFAGVLSILAFVFKIVLSKELLIAGVAASVGSIIFNIISELTSEGADYVPATQKMLDASVLMMH